MILTVVALHGPQRCGKNTVTDVIVDHIGRDVFQAGTFSGPFKRILNGIVGYEFTDAEKDDPHPLLGGNTPRNAQIYLGQMDEHFGGALWARHSWEVEYFAHYHGMRALLEACGMSGVVYESVGRQGQWDFFVNLRNQGKIKTRLIEVIRPGFVYKDNRQKIEDPAGKNFVIVNAGDIKSLEHTIWSEVVPWILSD